MTELIHGTPDLMPFEPDERYRIKSDAEADRWVEKIREARADRDRLVNACNERIAEFEARAKAAEEDCEKETGFALGLLYEYFGSVDRKHSKTQESYSLPSGKLVYKKPTIAPRIDDERLLEWARASAPEYITTVQKAKWSDLKKALVLQDDHYIFSETGEVVDGLTPEEKEGGFDIK